ncbi:MULTISPECIES: conjugal transfer protein TraH [Vibrio]|uniref:Conjugative transfer pilus assembly protein, TraH n=1 Tax=Vibrio alginolyticus TaxID=663 RepID=A0A0N9DYU6_VIBAL|nr:MULTISPECIES: conjugal transfer protein TraH [Vibrio]MDW2294215.1 conjugal transfer protein TraH [Vibrio sp. 1404]ALF35151.1 Conjugative transfer pilus assembly protein, TraH [Vibrio alginolyticus]MCA2455315.1 conjugal transfer protein TraH [Vibrio alginolyticus]MCA2460565.1 conjugal transfer protein TraH [Vibrio alginolyticus]MDW2266948.1 conjugal transfer protein TraH [Vibrio sp. 1394]
MKKVFQVSLIACAIGFSSISQASLQQEMNQLFGSMTNTTAPGVFESQRRGVIAGGSVVVRNRIMNENLVSMVPPSFQAGCGGIDMFAGSLSFVNADQFVQLLRSVAANAKGYAFQLALSAMCEKCSQHMETLQKKIQQLNEYFGNSCQMAQGVVNDTLAAFGKKGQTEASMLSSLKGAGDIFTSWSESNGKNPYENASSVAASDVNKTIKGNLVWRALKRHSASSWFASGDDRFLEAVMSVTGSIIVGDLANAADGQGKAPKLTRLNGNKVTIEHLIHGGNVAMYRCDTVTQDGCLNPTITNVTLTGLSTQVENLLLGTGSSNGIIFKFARNTGAANTTEKAFMTSAPASIGGMIRTLSALNEGAARSFASRAAPFIAVEMARALVEDMLNAARSTSGVEDHAYAKLLTEDLERARRQINEEYAALQRRYGSEQELLAHFNQVIQTIRKQRYYTVKSTALGE